MRDIRKYLLRISISFTFSAAFLSVLAFVIDLSYTKLIASLIFSAMTFALYYFVYRYLMDENEEFVYLNNNESKKSYVILNPFIAGLAFFMAASIYNSILISLTAFFLVYYSGSKIGQDYLSRTMYNIFIGLSAICFTMSLFLGILANLGPQAL